VNILHALEKYLICIQVLSQVLVPLLKSIASSPIASALADLVGFVEHVHKGVCGTLDVTMCLHGRCQVVEMKSRLVCSIGNPVHSVAKLGI
jgi:hypothetical protein